MATKLLRIVFAIPYFWPAWQYGGQPRAAFELARSLVKRGHSVRVLTTDSGGRSRLSDDLTQQPRPHIVEGIEIFYYRNVSNHLAFNHRIFWPPALFRDARKQLSSADVLHIHEFRSSITVAVSHAARVLGLPYAISPHGGLPHLGRRGIKITYDRLWGMTILNGAAAIVAISPAEKADIQCFGIDPAKIVELPNGIPPEDYKDLPKYGAFREKWSLGEKKVLLFLGRLHWIKGADLLIEAFNRQIRYYPDSHLVIAGPDDGQELALRQLVASYGLNSKVSFVGYCDQQDKLSAFVDADLLIVPSRSEVFALTVLEALACGCPVLLSDVCGLHPMPQSSEGVIRFAANDPVDLSVKLARALDTFPIPAVAAAGRRFVLETFAADVVSTHAEMIYYRIAGKTDRG